MRPRRPPNFSRGFAAERLESRLLLATASGVMFNDRDADGVRDAGEAGLAGRAVYHDENDDGSWRLGEARTETDAAGAYSLTFPSGDIFGGATREVLRELPVSNWRPTVPAGGFHRLTVGRNTVAAGVDFGNTQAVEVRGLVVLDADADGLRDASPDPLAGWTVFADFNGDGVLQPGSESSAVTDAAGRYSLFLPYSGVGFVYGMRAAAPAGFRMTHSTGGRVPITVTGPLQVIEADLMYTDRRVFTGTVFGDADGDGRRDPAATEQRLPGWTLYADLDDDAQLDDGEPRAVTDASGAYRLVVGPLPTPEPAPVVVREVPRPGWRRTSPAPPGTWAQPIGNGQVLTGIHFLNTQVTLVSGQVLEDENADGVRDAAHRPLSEWTVFADLDFDGFPDSGEPSDVTDAAGAYDLVVSATGTFFVKTVVQGGYRPSGGVGPLGPGEVRTGADVFYTRRPQITFRNVNDLNADGVAGPAEPTMLGWTFYHDANDNGVLDAGESVNDAPNNALAPPPGPGAGPATYTVGVVRPNGWRTTEPAAGRVVLSLLPGEFRHAVFLHTQAAVVTGVVFEDIDGDGAPDAAESGLPGRRVYLDADDNGRFDGGERWVNTDATGRYSLFVPPDSVPAGTVLVRPVESADLRPTVPATGVRALELSRGLLATGVNFGGVFLATVTGRNFHDYDGDGRRDPNEPDLAGWRVYEDADGNGRFDTTESAPARVNAADGLPRDVEQGTTAYSRIHAGGQLPRLLDVNVVLTLTHPVVNSLWITLVAPGGERVDLLQFPERGATHPDVTHVTFDDEAAVSLADPAAWPLNNRPVRPFQALSRFDGIDPNGQWTLEVKAGSPGPGALHSWSLEVAAAERSALIPATEPYALRVPPGPIRVVRVEPPAGWVQTYPGASAYVVSLASRQTVADVDFAHNQGPAPRVADVFVSGSRWAAPFKSSLAGGGLGNAVAGFRVFPAPALPAAVPVVRWAGVDRVVVRFDAQVATDAFDLVLRGAGGTYTAAAAAPLAGVANAYVFSFAAPLDAAGGSAAAWRGGTLSLELDADAPNGVSAADGAPFLDGDGDGVPGADYTLRFDVLPGDADRNRRVNASDLFAVRRALGFATTSPSRYNLFADVDADGVVTARDVVLARSMQGGALPQAAAPAPAAPGSSTSPPVPRRWLYSLSPVLGGEGGG